MVKKRIRLRPEDFHILLLLTERPKHGYALLDELSQRTGGELELGPSSLYYTLGRLEDAGLIREVDVSDSDEPHDAQRRYYALTAAGREQLADFVVTMEEAIRQARIAGFEPGRAG